MSSPREFTGESAETLRGSVEDELQMPFRNWSEEDELQMPFRNWSDSFSTNNDIDSIFATLQEAMAFEDMECRIVVSSMVREAITRGVLKALSEESSEQLTAKDNEIFKTRDILKEKEATIVNLEKALEENSMQGRNKQVWGFLHESQQKWRESEALVEEKERDLSKLAYNMVEMASILDNESKRVVVLEKLLKDLRDQDSRKSKELATLHEEVERIRTDHQSSHGRLKKGARLKEMKFNESIDRIQAGKEKQIIELERLIAEKDGQVKELEKVVEEKDDSISCLEKEIAETSQDLELHKTKVRILCDETDRLLKLEQDSLSSQERIEEQRFMREAESGLIMVLFEGWMLDMERELEQPRENGTSPSHRQQEILACHMNDQRLQDLKLTCEEVDLSNLADILEELRWKHDAEGMLILGIAEGWNKEVTEALHQLILESALKDEEIISRGIEVDSLKQAVEELESGYTSLASICIALMKGQSDIRDETKARLMQDLEGGSGRVSEGRELLKSRETSSERQEEKLTLGLQLEERLAEQEFQHEMELEIISEVFQQKYREAADRVLDLNSTLDRTSKVAFQSRASEVWDTLKTREAEGSREELKTSTRSLEELEAQLDSLMEHEACRLERIKSGCSTSIAKCEFKLDNLMESLANQVNEMKIKISFVQEAIKQQEWKHNVEDEILVLVLMEAVEEMRRKLEAAEISEQDQSIHMKPSQKDAVFEPKHRQDPLAASNFASKAVGCCLKPVDEPQRQTDQATPTKRVEHPVGLQDKDKLISSLKREIEELKREQEQVLEVKTEEMYKLKRQYWKEREFWMSNMSQPKGKEVEGLSRCSSEGSPWLEDELKRIEAAKLDSLTSKLREEWQIEKAGLLEDISQRERDMKYMTEELAELVEKEKGHATMEAHLLARIAGLETERDNLILGRNNQESLYLRCRQEWQTEKADLLAKISQREKGMKDATQKLAEVSDKEDFHVRTEARLLAHIAELETERDWLIKMSQPKGKEVEGLSRCSLEGSPRLEDDLRRIEAAKLDSLTSKLREEWEIEKAGLLEEISRRERDMKNMAEELAELAQKEKGLATMEAHLLAHIAGLETERDNLILERHNQESLSLRCRHEWQTEKADLLDKISQREEEMKDATQKLADESEKENSHVRTETRLLAHIAELETERDRLIIGRHLKESSATSLLEEKEIALALAVKEREEEEKRRKVLEMQLQGLRHEVKNLQGLNEEVARLQDKLESVQRQMELKFAEQISQHVKASQEFEYRVAHKMQERIGSLDAIKEKCRLLKGHFKSFTIRESHYKWKLDKELSNLQKAEAEVDLLGDEVDALVTVLEKVYVAFDLYAPVLQHYPGITELAQLVKQEIQLRIDPRYGL